MKKLFKSLVLVLFTLVILISYDMEVNAKSKTLDGIVLSNNVAVYSDTKGSKKIYTFSQGTQVKVIGTKGNYYILQGTHNRTGYSKKSSIALSYLLVDISDQKLYVYKEGKKQWSASVVTGKKGVSDTPKGHYTLKRSNFKRNTTLMGDTHVDYWMPFITGRGIGFHDASWQSSFGGSRYIRNGSHGCVNMKTSDAKKLYNSAPSKIDVIVRQ